MKHRLTILILITALVCSSLPAGAGEEPSTITFELLAKTTYGDNPPPVFPAELSKLEGKPVRIAGFMVPYTDTEKFGQLVLVNSPGGCYFCSAPLPTAVVFIRRPATDPPLQFTEELMSFEGVLHLWNGGMKDDDNAKGFFFTLDDARVSTQSDWLAKGVRWIKNKVNAK